MITPRTIRVALVADMHEEGWPSMDLVADHLHAALAGNPELTVELLRPQMRRMFSNRAARAGFRYNADRLLNRYVFYPRWLRARRSDFDVFHIVDHSYAQLVHVLPAARTIVSCHDTDTFRCLVHPEEEPRPWWFRAMTQRTLTGFRMAAEVVASSEATRSELLKSGLASESGCSTIPLAPPPQYANGDDANANRDASELLGALEPGSVDVLHVGSTIERKRIDILLEAFASIRSTHPRARLIRVGGPLAAHQRAHAVRLGIHEAIVELPHLATATLVAVYRRAALLLLPSQREGFGLPLIEALSCGTPVLASRIPALLQIGGDAATFASTGDAKAWSAAALALLDERTCNPAAWRARQTEGRAHATRYSWAHTAQLFAQRYVGIAQRAQRPSVLALGKYYPPAKGGIETHVQQLAQGVAGRLNVRMVVSNDRRVTQHEHHEGGIRVTRTARVAEFASAQLCPGLLGELLRDESDIVHLHLPNPPAAAVYLASGHKGRLVVTYHSDIVRQRFVGAILEPMLHRVLDRADTIIVSSAQYLDTSTVLARHRDRCVIVPFGVDTLSAESAAAEQPAVDAIRARHGGRIVVAAGRFSWYKGFTELIDAMRDVDAQLLLVGAGPLQGVLEREIVRCGVADRVTLPGAVPELRPYLSAADVFVLPSTDRTEAFGIVQVEAMACGTPVINTALTTGVPFVSVHGETGLTVPPRDPRALSVAINQLLDDDEMRVRMGAAARVRATNVFDLGTMIEATLKVYERALLPAAPRTRVNGSYAPCVS